MPSIERALNSAVRLFERYVAAEPKLTFTTAVGAWALAILSSHVSMLLLAWLSFVALTAAGAGSQSWRRQLTPRKAAAPWVAVALYQLQQWS